MSVNITQSLIFIALSLQALGNVYAEYGDKFRPAKFDKDGKLFFTPEQEINWKSFAPKKLQKININDNWKQDIEYITENGSQYYVIYSYDKNFYEFSYPIELKGNLPEQYYYYVNESGIQAVTLGGLEGRVSYGVSANKYQLSGGDFKGFAFVDKDIKPMQPETGGFIFFSNEELKIQTHSVCSDCRVNFFAKKNSNDASFNKHMSYSYVEKGKPFKPRASISKHKHGSKIEVVYEFDLNDEPENKYIFVRWDKDFFVEMTIQFLVFQKKKFRKWHGVPTIVMFNVGFII